MVKSYAAVVTTGIYCRPGCGARPRSDHVVQFPLAAAAEAAGYRACLQCRPYRYPQRVVTTRPDLVCRAVQLILDGGLDAATETTLSARLGISPRHLRRLFTEHLGVTPDGLARSARTHFARRLLDDTDLSVSDIAFAAGFGSVRQLNRTCLAVFRMTPNQLRERRRRADRLIADGGLLLRLPFHGPMDWDATLDLLASQTTPGVEHVSHRTYQRTITVEGHAGVLELTSGGHDHLLLRLHLPRWRELLHLVGRARRLASLDLDLDTAIERLADDPTIGPLLAQRPGLRPPGCWDPFETGVRAILDHPGKETGRRLAARIVERFGAPVQGLTQLGLTHRFPSPATLQSAPLDDLRLAARQEQALRAFSLAVASGQLRLDGGLPLGRLLAELTATCGIDEPAAQYVALRLGEPDAYPAPESRSRRDGPDASPWSPWRAVAATHLGLPGHAQQRPAAGPLVASGRVTRP